MYGTFSLRIEELQILKNPFMCIFWTRRPATTGIFSALQLCRRCFLEGWKWFFFENTLSSTRCLIFRNFKVFRFLARKTQFRCKREILYTHCKNEICDLADFENIYFFPKKKTNCIRIWKSYYFSRILRQICNYLLIKSFRRLNRAILHTLLESCNWQMNVKNVHNMNIAELFWNDKQAWGKIHVLETHFSHFRLHCRFRIHSAGTTDFTKSIIFFWDVNLFHIFDGLSVKMSN